MWFFLLFCFSFSSLISAEPIQCNKVVIWGHKLHSHTHSYIHNAFYRAFKSMGYETYWFDNQDRVSDFDFSHSLFITEGQADGEMPVREDCYYILHNTKADKYKQLIKQGKAIILQVYSDDCLQQELTKIAPCIYVNISKRIIHMPWATDLLPNEINTIKKRVERKFAHKHKRRKYVCWIGTYGTHGPFQNATEITPFVDASKKEGARFVRREGISVEENISLVLNAYMAPTIVGPWQKEKGYIPCRIFKNISYGQMGITNSYRVWELFEKKIVYNSDPRRLFYDAKEKLAKLELKELLELMDFVKTKHTYINRIETLLNFLAQVREG